MERKLISMVALIMLTSLLGCAPVKFKPLEFPPDIALQDPLPGHAIVYLLRAPHDGTTLAVYLNHTLVAKMPAETYTAISLLPGIYSVSSATDESDGRVPPVDAATLTVSAGQRRFLYTSVPSESNPTMATLLGGPLGVIPLLALTTVYGQRTWQECRDLDAQGLMSIGTVVLPVRSSL